MAKNTMYEAPNFSNMSGVIVEHKTETGAVSKLEFVPERVELQVVLVEHNGVVMPKSLADAMIEQENKMVG